MELVHPIPNLTILISLINQTNNPPSPGIGTTGTAIGRNRKNGSPKKVKAKRKVKFRRKERNQTKAIHNRDHQGKAVINNSLVGVVHLRKESLKVSISTRPNLTRQLGWKKDSRSLDDREIANARKLLPSRIPKNHKNKNQLRRRDSSSSSSSNGDQRQPLFGAVDVGTHNSTNGGAAGADGVREWLDPTSH